VWVLGAAVGGHYLTRGWVPHDAGSLAQSAERVLAGELPHRDFDDIYTGGLSFLHALAFRLFGTSLLSLRLVLFAAFLAWLPAVYYVAGRFVAPLAAGLATLTAALWTVPNYSEAVPSWYNLFLAVLGVAALLRHLETGGRRWLVAAGVVMRFATASGVAVGPSEEGVSVGTSAPATVVSSAAATAVSSTAAICSG